MSNIIIIEGIDRVGKTTLCKNIHEKLGLTIYNEHEGATQNESYNKLVCGSVFSAQIKMLEELKTDVVIDRFHISEAVYGIVKRCYDTKQTAEYFYEVEEALMKHNTLLIHVLPTSLEWSSVKHGSDLTNEYRHFTKCYNASEIKKKMTCTFNDMQNPDFYEYIAEKLEGGYVI